MINTDKVFQAVQGLRNKDQRSSIKALEYNSFSITAMADILDDIRITIQNDKLGILIGKQDMERLEYSKEALGYFFKLSTISESSGIYPKPSDIEQREYLYYEDNRIEEAQSFKHIKLLGRMGKHLSYIDNDGLAKNNMYFLDTETGYKIYPSTFTEDVEISYWRTFNEPKWTYFTINGTAVYNGAANDAQNFELPQRFFDDLVYRIAIMSGINIKDTQSIQPLFGIKKEEEQENVS